MTTTTGYYYWRGRVLKLQRRDGRDVVLVPRDLVDRWRRDVRQGRVTLGG